jgi:hypothetical protein
MKGVTTMSEVLNETTGELAIIQNNTPGLASELANMGRGQIAGYSSIVATSFEDRVAALDAMSNSTPLDENIGKEFQLKDVIIQHTIMPNAVGIPQEVPRITLITPEGKGYHVMSDVVFKDLKNIFTILGEPKNWPAPVTVVATKESAKVGKFITLRTVRKAK